MSDMKRQLTPLGSLIVDESDRDGGRSAFEIMIRSGISPKRFRNLCLSPKAYQTLNMIELHELAQSMEFQSYGALDTTLATIEKQFLTEAHQKKLKKFVRSFHEDFNDEKDRWAE
jgi:hypothetical protein